LYGVICPQTIPAEELFTVRHFTGLDIIAAGVEMLKLRIACLSEMLQEGRVTVQVCVQLPCTWMPFIPSKNVQCTTHPAMGIADVNV
jgi:hypothetical protein